MKSHPRVRAVFFDVVGTLLQVRGGVGRIYWELAQPYGVRVEPEAIDRAFGEVFGSAPPLAFPGAAPGATRRLEKQWWYEIVNRVYQKVGPLERFDDYFETVFNHFATPENWELFPDTLPVLSELKSRGLVVGIISNFDSRIYPLLSELGIFQWTDSVTISSREGAAKPDSRIFSRALLEHDLTPAEAVHVGDSLLEDVEGARGAGLHAFHLQRNSIRSRHEPSIVSSLSEVPDRIDSL